VALCNSRLNLLFRYVIEEIQRHTVRVPSCTFGGKQAQTAFGCRHLPEVDQAVDMVLKCVHQRQGTGLTTCRSCGPYSGSGRIAYQRLDIDIPHFFSFNDKAEMFGRR
jgi:hypothetical protein